MGRILISDFAKLSDEDKNKWLRENTESKEQYLPKLENQIKNIEVLYGLSRETIKSDLAKGKIEETDEVCSLLMLMRLKKELTSFKK